VKIGELWPPAVGRTQASMVKVFRGTGVPGTVTTSSAPKRSAVGLPAQGVSSISTRPVRLWEKVAPKSRDSALGAAVGPELKPGWAIVVNWLLLDAFNEPAVARAVQQ
jgi:hypothetical protein